MIARMTFHPGGQAEGLPLPQFCHSITHLLSIVVYPRAQKDNHDSVQYFTIDIKYTLNHGYPVRYAVFFIHL